jgi:hypothetical protein
VINFPFPGQADRARIWRQVFPDQTPVNGLDYDFLARLNLAGGNIHNIALDAAFRAAKSGEQVSMPLLLEAARAECNKIGQPVSESFFHYEKEKRPGGSG